MQNTFLKEIVVNSVKKPFYVSNGFLTLVKIFLNEPSTVLIHPDVHGERLYIYCDRRKVDVEGKYLEVEGGLTEKREPLSKIILVTPSNGDVSKTEYSVTNDKGELILLSFIADLCGTLYLWFNSTGGLLKVQSLIPSPFYKGRCKVNYI
jgi:hypothetical protein